MKSTFRAYYPPSDEELQDLWDRGLIVLDANALLVFFRYSASTRNEFLRVLTEKRDSLWLPYQVGLEFHRNWLKVVAEQRHAFGRTIEALDKLDGQMIESLSKLNIKRHTALDVDRIRKRLSKRIAKVRAEVSDLQRAHRDSLKSGEDSDVLNRIAELYDGRVGAPYDSVKLEKLYKDGQERYARDQPPGFRDKDKEEPDRYGDLVLWRQLLDMAATEKRSAIFITDDLKDDWWLFVGGERKGPRPELIQEYLDATGTRIHFYTPESFLKFADARGAMVSPAAQDEVKQVSRAHRVVSAHSDMTLREMRLAQEAERPGRAEFASEVIARRRRARNRIRILEEQQVDLRHRRNAIEHQIAELPTPEEIQDDEGMLKEYLEVLLDERVAIDAQLARVTEELASAHDAEHGQARLIEEPRDESGVGQSVWANYITRERAGNPVLPPWPASGGQGSPFGDGTRLSGSD